MEKCVCGFEAKNKAGLVAHQKACLNFDATKPVEKIPAEPAEMHALNVGGKVVYVPKVKPRP